jgi:metal-responsive CopG/Arc/MetJ family transcriptional regulator
MPPKLIRPADLAAAKKDYESRGIYALTTIGLKLSPKILDEIEEFRFTTRARNRMDAIRALIRIGLDGYAKRKKAPEVAPSDLRNGHVQICVQFDPEMMAEVEDFRFHHRFRNRMDTVRTLLAAGLAKNAPERDASSTRQAINQATRH